MGFERTRTGSDVYAHQLESCQRAIEGVDSIFKVMTGGYKNSMVAPKYIAADAIVYVMKQHLDSASDEP